MNRSDKRPDPTSKTASDAFQDIASLSKKLITDMLVRMIENSENYHSWSLSDQDSTRLVKLIKGKQRMICSSFAFQLKKNFTDFKTDSKTLTTNSARDWQKLGLVGASDLAEVDQLQAITTRYSDAFKEFDKTILKRLQYSVKRSRAHIYDNPLQVKRLCESFQYSIDGLSLEVSYKLALYHLFADRFIESLGPLYRKIDQALIQHGFIQDLNPARIQIRDIDGLSQSKSPASIQISQSATLLSLLQRFKEKTRLPSSKCKNLFPELKQQFIRHGLVENTDQIDQLNLIFKLIFEDEDLPQPVKQQLSRLQIYVFITAIQEEDFLKRSSNPARRLLDTIIANEVEVARLGNSKLSGIRFIREQIDALTKLENISLDSYSKMLDGYQEFVLQEPSPKQNTKNSAASKKVMSDVKAKLAKITNPLKKQGTPLILFDNVWLPLMVQIALKQGMTCKAWKMTFTMVKTQAWALIPKSTKKEQKELVETLPQVAHSLHRAMRSLKLDDNLQQSLRDYLNLEHQDVIEKTAIKIKQAEHKTRSLASRTFDPVKAESDEFSAMMQTGVFEVTEEMLEVLNSKGKNAKKAPPTKTLEKGEWVEIRQGQETVKAKLTWKAEDDSLYIFIDREGKRVCEVDAETLGQRLVSGDISRLNSSTVSKEKSQFSIMGSL